MNNKALSPSLASFHYASGRLGFLAKAGNKQMPLTVDLEQVKNKKTVIFRTYGRSEKLATALSEKFIETANWKRVGTIIVGHNKVLEVNPPKGYHEQLKK